MTENAAKPTRAIVRAYAKTHSRQEAADHFAIPFWQVKKWCAGPDGTPKKHARTYEAPQRPADLSASHAPKEADTPPALVPTFAEVSTDEVASGDELWKDPWTGELLHPPPGAVRRDWEQGRRSAQQRHLARIQADLADPAPGPTHGNTAVQSATAVVDLSAPTPDPQPLTPEAGPAPVVERVVVVRRLDYAPVQRGGLLPWVRDHEYRGVILGLIGFGLLMLFMAMMQALGG